MKLFLLAAFALLSVPAAAQADEFNVAVAANFTAPAKEIATAFERKTGHKPILSFGATGQFYAQIKQEAPFVVFMAADDETPRKAVEEGLAVPESRFTYAVGRLVLWTKASGSPLGEDTLRKGAFDKLAIANPATAPYGAAAVQAMKTMGVFETLQPTIVQGNTIAQTFQFAEAGAAELAFVALSQVIARPDGARWPVPEALHAPILQDAVLLKKGAGNEAAKAFLAFLKGPEAATVISKYGYGTKADPAASN
ncbi:molybdate ABC transporter substrate-binding protein [Roseomonas genomospecies 6]|uniref:Molybdate ABC transporter substrate-binding protein n=1 Tax=Roseomonas genomospecies 6 TaxID=214106 RepID=A0A9W7KR65_9PROT|nr:molybdate ABC transporter substrate-binding protein [Roseomonas genomospecies 6]KAA0677862.1 molybdate ABC transporter substrate-binding protein [Roseomonas genomospecies 6]